MIRNALFRSSSINSRVFSVLTILVITPSVKTLNFSYHSQITLSRALLKIPYFCLSNLSLIALHTWIFEVLILMCKCLFFIALLPQFKLMCGSKNLRNC